MQWNTQSRNITTNIKVQVDFTIPTLSATTVMKWNCHVDESAKDRYDMILGQDLLKQLVLNIKLSKHVIKLDNGPFNGSTIPIVDIGKYLFKILNTGEIIPE